MPEIIQKICSLYGRGSGSQTWYSNKFDPFIPKIDEEIDHRLLHISMPMLQLGYDESSQMFGICKDIPSM